MSGTASGVTSFVLGTQDEGNREVRTFENGQSYDLDFADVQGYTADDTTFPFPTA